MKTRKQDFALSNLQFSDYDYKFLAHWCYPLIAQLVERWTVEENIYPSVGGSIPPQRISLLLLETKDLLFDSHSS